MSFVYSSSFMLIANSINHLYLLLLLLLLFEFSIAKYAWDNTMLSLFSVLFCQWIVVLLPWWAHIWRLFARLIGEQTKCIRINVSRTHSKQQCKGKHRCNERTKKLSMLNMENNSFEYTFSNWTFSIHSKHILTDKCSMENVRILLLLPLPLSMMVTDDDDNNNNFSGN